MYGYDGFSDYDSDEYGYGDPYGYKYAFRDSDSDSDDYLFGFPKEPIVPKKGRKLLVLMKRKNLKGLKEYVDQGHPTCYITGYFVVPIHRAIRLRDLDIFNILVEAPDFNVNIKDTQGRTPLMRICAKTKITPVLDQMLETLMKQPNMDVNIKDCEQKTALHHAASSGNLTLIKKLVDMGLDVNLEDKNKVTPFEDALKASYCHSAKPEVIEFLISQGADVWHTSKNGNYPLDAVIANWDLCNSILMSIPEEMRLQYVSRKRKIPLLLLALEKNNYEMALELLKLGVKFEDVPVQHERSLVKNLCFIDVVEGGQAAESLMDKIDLEPIMDRQCNIQSWSILGSLHFGCGPVQLTTLWIFTKRFRSFSTKTYPVFTLKRFDNEDQIEHTKLYRLWTVLSEALATEAGLYELKHEYLRFLMAKPGTVVSERSSHASREIMPPLIAVGLPTKCILSGFEESLDLLLENGATVRTRHCFSLFTSKCDGKDFKDLIKPYFTKGIFYLDDLFEDDLSMLFRTIRLYPLSVTKHDEFLNFLLTKRLQHSKISVSKLRELQKFLKAKRFPLTKSTLEKAFENYSVRPLLVMTRLALKNHFSFFEDQITNYLKETNTPESMVEYIIKGNSRSVKLFN